ncbi:MAG: hypothetical protein QOJ19_2826 [Acidimicrobiia bacterium]|nr:hypothetical protein [Acidimicrobiia bacterium]
MRYMLLIYSNPENWEALPPEDQQKLTNDYFAFSQSIAETGEMIAGDPLQGVDTATTVRVRNGKGVTTDGPFVETREHLGGYYLVDCLNLDRAIELAARIPDAALGAIEVRPLREFPSDMPR